MAPLELEVPQSVTDFPALGDNVVDVATIMFWLSMVGRSGKLRGGGVLR